MLTEFYEDLQCFILKTILEFVFFFGLMTFFNEAPCHLRQGRQESHFDSTFHSFSVGGKGESVLRDKSIVTNSGPFSKVISHRLASLFFSIL